MLNIFTFLPAMLADLGIGYVIYRVVAYGRLTRQKGEEKPSDPSLNITIRALIMSALWVLNPAVILISSVWGQVESLFTIFLLISLLLLREKKLLASYLVFAVAIIVKAQSLFLAPIYLYSAFAYLMDNLYKTDADGNRTRIVLWDSKDAEATPGSWGFPTLGFAFWGRRRHGIYIDTIAWGRLVNAILASVLLMIVLMLPFAQGFNIMPVVRLYTGGLGTHAWTSVNAFNFWGLIHNVGVTWTAIQTQHVIAGVVVAVALVIGTIGALHRDHTLYGGRHYFFIIGALLALIFIFSVRMHERYLFPALLFFLIYYAQTREKWSHMGLGIYAALSVTFYINCIDVLRWLEDGAHASYVLTIRGPAISAFNVIIGGVLIVMLVLSGWMEKTVPVSKSDNKRKQKAAPVAVAKATKGKQDRGPRVNEPPVIVDPPRMKTRDYAYLFLLIIVYSIIAFARLGDRTAPQTSWISGIGETAVIDFGEMRHVSEFQFRMGAVRDASFAIEHSHNGFDWNHFETITPVYTDAYNWRSVSFVIDHFHDGINWGHTETVAPDYTDEYELESNHTYVNAQFIRIRPFGASTSEFVMQEVAFREPGGALIPIYGISESAEALKGEGNLTSWAPQFTESAVINFGAVHHVSQFQYRMGAIHAATFSFETSFDGIHWSAPEFISPFHTAAFHWTGMHKHFYAQFVRITPTSLGYWGGWGNGFRMQEVAFRGPDRELIPIHGISPGAEALVDEQGMVPLYQSFMNSAYFDEIFHPRAAYEHIHELRTWEVTHPPMGKNFIAMGVNAFGMTPFGWRFAGTLFGVMMVPLIYAFARLLLKSNNWALFAASIFTFDFMHFAQTRIATIDSYVTFFIIAMYFFMYMFLHGVERDSLRRKLVILGLCGISVGLAIASKWQGVYAVLGLPILLFPALYRLYIRDRKQATTIFYACFAFFIAIPLVIYLLSYVQVMVGYHARQPEGQSWIRSVWNNQISMYNYHSNLVAEHPFSSAWWEWPLNLRPIFLYSNAGPDGTRVAISSFGNPAVWWAGVVAIFFVLFYAIDTNVVKGLVSTVKRMSGTVMLRGENTRFDLYSILLWLAIVAQLLPFNGWPWMFRVAATAYIVGYMVYKKVDSDVYFLLVAFWAQFLPWVGIARLTWIYHFFPSVPFLVLIVAWVFKNYVKKPGIAIGYAVVVIALFALFYPVLSGLPISADFVRTYLQWLPRWHLI